MNIALIAHDNKKELMADFCIAYKAILEKHNLFATAATGAIVNEAAGLNVHCYSPGLLGEQQIAARVAYNEMDLVVYFRDTLVQEDDNPGMHQLHKLCDDSNIPFATNAGTAEILVKGLDRGDLEWRKLVNPLD